MRKFINCDIVNVLYEVMRHHTSHYQSDFDIDRMILREAALSDNPDRKYFLWHCRPSGTRCLNEREVYIRGTSAHNTWVFYYEQTRDAILPYAVEIKGFSDGKVIGDLYELDYSQHYHSLMKKASNNSGEMIITNSEGKTKTFPYTAAWDSVINFDDVSSVIILPDDPDRLEKTLKDVREERRNSEYYAEWDPDGFFPIGKKDSTDNKGEYEKLFDEFLDMVEFTLIKHPDDRWSVHDRQGADLGGINGDIYKDASELFDRMDSYVYDYFVVDLEECLEEGGHQIPDWFGYDELVDYARPLLPDNKWGCDVLDMIYSHANEIDLNKCFFENAEEYFGSNYSNKNFHDYNGDGDHM